MTGTDRGLRRIVVVGASLAGLQAATALRRHGFDGDLTVVGDEPHPPYDRPPLSKKVLLAGGGEPPPEVSLPIDPDLGAEWRLGDGAVALDPRSRRVELAGGQALAYDGLLVTTGAKARGWTGPGAGLAGLHHLRSLDDALRLRADLDACDAGDRVVVAGGGFIGAEVAAAAAARGLRVVLLEQRAALLAAQAGALVGDTVAATLTALGSTVHTATAVAGFDGDRAGRVAAVRTADGRRFPATVVVLGLGVVPATGWLTGSGATLRPHLLCDRHCLVPGPALAGRVAAAGDVATWPDPVLDDRYLAVGHWSNAREQADVAASNLLAEPADRVPYTHVPTFWSDIGPVRIRSVGVPGAGDRVTVVDGSVDDGSYLAVHTRADRVVAGVSVNRPRRLPALRRLIGERTPYDPTTDSLAPPPSRLAGSR